MEARALEIVPSESACTEIDRRIADALVLLGKGNRSAAEMRTLIMGLEAALQSLPNYVPGEDFDTVHHFGPGTYMRQALIPKGMVVTGRIHKTEHLNILSQGKLTVWTEDGMKTLTASTVITSKPGIKRAGYAHEDSVWITVHANPTNERDIKKLEKMLLADSFEEVFGPAEQVKIEERSEPCPQS